MVNTSDFQSSLSEMINIYAGKIYEICRIQYEITWLVFCAVVSLNMYVCAVVSLNMYMCAVVSLNMYMCAVVSLNMYMCAVVSLNMYMCAGVCSSTRACF